MHPRRPPQIILKSLSSRGKNKTKNFPSNDTERVSILRSPIYHAQHTKKLIFSILAFCCNIVAPKGYIVINILEDDVSTIKQGIYAYLRVYYDGPQMALLAAEGVSVTVNVALYIRLMKYSLFFVR